MYFQKVEIVRGMQTMGERLRHVKRVLIWSDGDDPNVPSMQFDGDENTVVCIFIRDNRRCLVLVRSQGEIIHKITLCNNSDEVEIERDNRSFSLFREAGEWWDSRRDY